MAAEIRVQNVLATNSAVIIKSCHPDGEEKEIKIYNPRSVSHWVFRGPVTPADISIIVN